MRYNQAFTKTTKKNTKNKGVSYARTRIVSSLAKGGYTP